MKSCAKGGIREMVAVALPMVISFSCDTAMTFVDRLFLSRLGPDLMNAAMGGGITAFLLITFFMGLIGFSTSLTAQYLGAGRKSFCAVVTVQALIIAALAYPVVVSLRPLAYLLFDFMNVPLSQLDSQVRYFDILLWGSIFTLWRHALSTFFSGIGRTRAVMISSAITMTVNIVANYFLIFGHGGFPALGIEGAAYGTILGSLSGVLALVGFFFAREYLEEYSIFEAFRFDWAVMEKLLRFGYPNGIEMFLNLLSFNTLVLLFHSEGSATATAATIMLNWDMVSFIPLLGVQVGVISLVGRYKGAGDLGAAEYAAKSGLKLGSCYSVAVLILFVFFPYQLVSVFSPQVGSATYDKAFETALWMIRCASLYVMTEAFIITYIGVLRGAGDTFCAMCISTSMHWSLVGVLFFMLKVANASPVLSWFAVIICFIPLSSLAYLRYRGGRWREIEVIDYTQDAEAVCGAEAAAFGSLE